MRGGTWIVIPGYNEEKVIGRTVAGLDDWLPRVVVVDDGSQDATAEDARIAGARVVRHAVNLGQGAALMTGLRFALSQGAEHIVTFDADGQHRADDIPLLLHAALHGGADVVLGSRFLARESAMPRARRLLLKAAVRYTNVTTGLRLTDAHNGLRLFTRRAAERLDLRHNRMAHASELIAWLGRSELCVREVPVEIFYTEYSLAKGQNAMSSLNILWDLWSGKLHH